MNNQLGLPKTIIFLVYRRVSFEWRIVNKSLIINVLYINDRYPNLDVYS